VLTVPNQPNWNAVDTGDVDNDGDIDILIGASVGNLTGAQNRLWINQRNNLVGPCSPVAGLGPTFSFVDGTACRLPAILDNTEDVEFADVDADGDLDAFVANFYCLLQLAPTPVVSAVGWQDYLLLNNGAGVFTPSPAAIGFPTQSLTGFNSFDNSIDCEFGDVDNDGDLDLVVGNWQVAAALPTPFPGISYEPNRLYLNNGAGVFTQVAAAFASFAMPTNDLEFLDYDRDGDLDLLEVNGNFTTLAPPGSPGVRNVLLQNGGGGTFTVDLANTVTLSGGGFVNALGAEVADMGPNRHAVDIVIATQNIGVITVLLP
jgi:hypothetical protein